MTFTFTNYTDKNMFVMGDVSTNCVENTTNHMELRFTNYTKNTFMYHMVNSFTNPIWNMLASINYPVDTFMNYMDNTFTNNIMQMNASETLIVDKDTGMDKNMRMIDKSIEFDYTELEDVDSYKAIQDTTNLDNHMNDENFCKDDPKRKYPESTCNRNISCAAILSLRLEHHHLNSSHLFEIKICFKHNYIVNCAKSLSFRHVDKKICNKFIQMFYDSYLPATALYTHENELHLLALSNESLVETLADRVINLDYTYVVHLFENYHNSQLGEQNTILQEYNLRMGKAFILYIVTGLMSRVHEKIQKSEEICYVDASASFESLNILITLMYTSCVAGALPLGLFVTSDELELTIEKALNLLKLILSEHAFFGCRCNVGLQNILTDNSAAK
ncbi:32597_t:CDS:2 [Gigaspora margarita]|uniref:32597_t:CDS:1 n=1 Tax=Gigaspora margarita TaxID=4874 RepID=A0ABN7VV20_GIGMA|nr:32597_t:CDS:2 [Gigaspora margarita]